MGDLNGTVDGLKQAVGDLFQNSPGPAIVNATAKVGQTAQDLYQTGKDAVSKALSRKPAPTRGDIVLPPDKRKGRSLTGGRR